MNKNRLILFLILIGLLTASTELSSDLKRSEKGEKDKADKTLRTVTQVYDQQKNTVSNIEFYTTNYGIFGLDVEGNVGGGFWPRNGQNQYIFGGGIWFAAKKHRPGSTDPNDYRKYVELTYNPNNGRSWMVPGRIEDGDLIKEDLITKYRTYFSTDFRRNDGRPFNTADGENWPIWDAKEDTSAHLKKDRYFGFYIYDENDRNPIKYKKGPAFISGEDIFCVFKDTDLNQFDGGATRRQEEGYPLKLQFEHTIYSWGFGDYKDFIFLRYDIINYSSDTLRDCWMAPMMDVDIARKTNSQGGAANDRVRFYNEDPTLNLAVQWTNTDQGERGYGFGYLGFDFLESPAVDENGFLRKDSAYYDNSSQLGLRTFRNWSIQEDKPEDEDRYNYVSSQVRDGDTGPGDKRFLMGTGPFNMRPGDTVRVIVGIILAGTAVKDEADGSFEDLAELVRKDKFAQEVYDNNFSAPIPPERSVLSWQPLNNAIKLMWDSTAEITNDEYESGMDFLGYRLYRARRLDRDTFDVDEISPTKDYTSGKGPFGWKEIASWRIIPPIWKSIRRGGTDQDNLNMPNIDSMRVVGPVFNTDGTLDTFAIKVMRIGRGIILPGPDRWLAENNISYIPQVVAIDTSYYSQPWGNFYVKKVNPPSDNTIAMYGKAGMVTFTFNDPDFILVGNTTLQYDPFNPNKPSNRHYLLDSVLIGTIYINKFITPYNPLLWKRQTVNFAGNDPSILPDKDKDTIWLKNTYRKATINGVEYSVIDRLIPIKPVDCMKDTTHIAQVLDSIYTFIQKGLAKAVFPQFEQSHSARFDVIVPYMERITNGRTFMDIGDDNLDYYINYNQDPTKSEKILNNVDYYYRLLAFDEGDYNQKTESKKNDAGEGLPNFVKAIPRASAAGEPAQFQITYLDSAKIGGLYNFRFYGIDQERINQLFAGHELELEFHPSWYLSSIQLPGRTDEKKFGLYRRRMTIKDLTTNKYLFEAITLLEATPCIFPYRGSFTEDAFSWVLADSAIIDTISGKRIEFGIWDNREVTYRTGKFSTGNFTTPGYCYSPRFIGEAYGTLGFSFDFTIQQRGGRFRPDTIYKQQGDAATPLSFKRDVAVHPPESENSYLTQQVDNFILINYFQGPATDEIYGSFNNGPGEYLITFQEGGFEDMTLEWGPKNQKVQKTFRVPYLTMQVENTISYMRPGPNGDVEVKYPGYLKSIVYPDTLYDRVRNVKYLFPNPRNLASQSDSAICKFNISAFGWINGRANNKIMELSKQRARPADGPLRNNENAYVGTQNRYYLSVIDGPDTLDFVNIFQIDGCIFAFDYANKGKRFGVTDEWQYQDVKSYTYGQDFKPGDKVMVKTTGGALGLPQPGAKVRFRVTQSQPKMEDYTDAQLDQVQVVPNPYYVSHQAQKSPYGAKIFFTKLPKRCTIDIYTVMGDHIRTIEHDELTSSKPDEEAVEVWDLLSSNKQRVASQTLVAIVKTPNGAQSVKKFSLVVGGYRIISEE